MDNSNMSKNWPSEYLGVNKIGKSIRKSPLHQPNIVNNNGSGNNNTPARQQPQPQVYNVSQGDFRSIVQQLTGSPSRNDPLPRPPNNSPSSTLINRDPTPPVVAAPPAPPQGLPMAPPPAADSYNNYARPPDQFGQPSPRGMQPLGAGDHSDRMNPAVSLSARPANMQQLESHIADGSPRRPHPQMQPQVPGSVQGQLQVQPHAPVQAQFEAQPPVQSQVAGQGQGQGQAQGQPPSSGLLPNPSMPPLVSPSMDGPAFLPSPTSQFLLHSSFYNMLSPTLWSPYVPVAYISVPVAYISVPVAFAKQLQSCITDGSPRPPHPQMQPQVPGSVQGQLQVQPHAPVQAQFEAQPPVQSQVAGQGQAQGQPPSSGLLPNPSMPPLASPSMNAPALLPSPTSQFPLPSPSFYNMLCPALWSPYPLLSPGSQFPPPLCPNFAFSSIAQSGILGPGPQPPLSPGIAFPPLPGFFPISSPS